MRPALKISDNCGLFARAFGLPFLGGRLGLGLVIWPCHGFRKEKSTGIQRAAIKIYQVVTGCSNLVGIHDKTWLRQGGLTAKTLCFKQEEIFLCVYSYIS